MRASYDHKLTSQWRTFNLGPGKRDDSIALFFAIAEALREVRTSAIDSSENENGGRRTRGCSFSVAATACLASDLTGVWWWAAQENFLRWPRLFFDSSVPKDRVDNLRRRAEPHGAVVVSRREEATHIVVLDPEVRRHQPRALKQAAP